MEWIPVYDFRDSKITCYECSECGQEVDKKTDVCPGCKRKLSVTPLAMALESSKLIVWDDNDIYAKGYNDGLDSAISAVKERNLDE